MGQGIFVIEMIVVVLLGALMRGMKEMNDAIKTRDPSSRDGVETMKDILASIDLREQFYT
jgi:hypothetical protein